MANYKINFSKNIDVLIFYFYQFYDIYLFSFKKIMCYLTIILIINYYNYNKLIAYLDSII